MTNDNVVSLVKAGLGDQVVIARINQAERVEFKLEDVDLIALKNNGVSGPIIEAMLKRVTPAGPAPAAGVVMPGMAGVPAGQISVTLVTQQGEIPLHSIAGDVTMTYAFVTVLRFMDYPGLRAETRIKDRSPSILLSSADSPTGRFFLAKADPDKKHGVRSIKLGRGGMYSVSGVMTPDADWTIPFTAEKLDQSRWRLTLKRPLVPGEYGMYIRNSEFYDFGVD